MPLTVSDITRDADLFRRAYPSWPHPEPEEAPVTPKTACWADPLSRAERRKVAELLARACQRFYYAATSAPDGRRATIRQIVHAQMNASVEMSDLHLDVTERAEVAAS